MTPVKTVWNDRDARTGTRRADTMRPWYAYARELTAHVRPGTALDVGCGVGEFMQILWNCGFQTQGVDGSASHVERVRNKGLRAETADLEQELPFAPESFDLVTCLEVIEHVARAEHFLSEIHRVLEPRGALIVSTPNFSFLNARLRYLRGAAPLNEGIHLRFFNPPRLEQLLRDAQFEIVARNSYGIVPLLSTLNLRLLHRPAAVWRVPPALENAWAYDLIWLARKK